ncbi:MAG: dihydrofolate reductase [Pseudomonadales bacterium]
MSKGPDLDDDKMAASPLMSLIVAMTRNRCIGNDNSLMWHLRADLQNFKRVTSGKPVIMGRKTYDSIGRPLPARFNIVVSRQTGLQIAGCEVASSIAQAKALAIRWCKQHDEDEYFVLGGAEIYNQCMADIDRLYVTLVDAEMSGDAWFPEFDESEWQETSRIEHQKDKDNDWDFSVLEYRRKIA